MFNNWLIEKICLGYIVTIVVYGFLSLLFRTAKSRKRQFLNIANLAIVFILTLNLIWVGQDAMACKVQQMNRQSGTYGYDFYLTGSCFLPVITTVLLEYAVQFFFWFNRHRIKWALTIVSVFMLLLLHYFERLNIIVMSWYRDYLPSSWSITHERNDLVWIMIFSLAYFSFCYFIPAWTTKTRLNSPNKMFGEMRADE